MVAVDDIVQVKRFTNDRPAHLVVLKLWGISSENGHTYRHFDARGIRKSVRLHRWVPGTKTGRYSIDETGHITGFNGPAVVVARWE